MFITALLFSAIAFLAGIWGLHLISKHLGLWTTLFVVIFVYWVAHVTKNAPFAELQFLSGLCQLLGFAGLLLCILAFFRRGRVARKVRVSHMPRKTEVNPAGNRCASCDEKLILCSDGVVDDTGRILCHECVQSRAQEFAKN